jgi:hypothetical protein
MTSKTRIRPLLWALLLSATAALPALAAEALTKPLTVLFLGDQGHHRPADRAPQLIPVLATRGIDVTYTESMADLNPSTLAKYDVLMIYANT